MARELVETCERRGRLPELIETVRRLRPDAAPIASDPLSQRLHEIRQIPQAEREARLLAALDHAPFLLVLDGLERILIAYARLDAARLSDDDFDRQTANVVAGAYGLPASAAQSFVGQHRLRKTADPRAARSCASWPACAHRACW